MVCARNCTYEVFYKSLRDDESESGLNQIKYIVIITIKNEEYFHFRVYSIFKKKAETLGEKN